MVKSDTKPSVMQSGVKEKKTYEIFLIGDTGNVARHGHDPVLKPCVLTLIKVSILLLSF